MEFNDLEGYSLLSLAQQNVLLGKNGSGKSSALKIAARVLRGRTDIGMGLVRYLSPERAGSLQYEAGIEQSIANNPDWLFQTRGANQASQFRQQSAAQFRMLETLTLRAIEKTPALRSDNTYTFDTTVGQINSLLDNVQLRRSGAVFDVFDKATGVQVNTSVISSGEAELISLGIEGLMFARECKPNATNLLLFDEPDVHLHPDLQWRFAQFLHDLSVAHNFTLIIATHSTPFLASLSNCGNPHVCFMRQGERALRFEPVAIHHKRVFPVFGAHPLSNVFNASRLLLVEGGSDERIWQQAVRSSGGRINLYPVAAGSVSALGDAEQAVDRLLPAIYDNPVGYSLRDGDGISEDIDDLFTLKRFRLACRTPENLLLTDEVLASAGTTWEELAEHIDTWLTTFVSHPQREAMQAFKDGGFDRRSGEVKELRNLLVSMMGSTKPWEVLVGQSLASLTTLAQSPTDYSLQTFLGPRVAAVLLNLQAGS